MSRFAEWYRWLRNALRRDGVSRRGDRLEAMAVLMVIAAALIAVPYAVGVGERTHSARLLSISDQQRQHHIVDATAVTDSVLKRGQFTRQNSTVVQWSDGNDVGTATVETSLSLSAGAPVTVWLDDEGNVVRPPEQPIDAATKAVFVAVAFWLSVVALAVLVAAFIRLLLSRHRDRAWEYEFRILTHDDDGWANRDT